MGEPDDVGWTLTGNAAHEPVRELHRHHGQPAARASSEQPEGAAAGARHGDGAVSRHTPARTRSAATPATRSRPAWPSRRSQGAAGTSANSPLSRPNRVTDVGGTVAGGWNNQAGNGGAVFDGPVCHGRGRGRQHGGRRLAPRSAGAAGDAGEQAPVRWWPAEATTSRAARARPWLEGQRNTASGQDAAVVGGGLNVAAGNSSTVAGGILNSAGGSYAVVPGGSSNVAGGHLSLAAGFQAQVRTASQSGDGQRGRGHVRAGRTLLPLLSSPPAPTSS